MYAYSQDLRDRVLRALERGDRPTAMANRFEVSRVWVYQGRTPSQADGTAWQSADWWPPTGPVGRDGAGASGLAEGRRRSDARGAVRTTGGTRDCDQRACVVASTRSMEAHAYPPLHTSEQERADVQAARREWQAAHPALDITKLVFLDETGASTNMARRTLPRLRSSRTVAHHHRRRRTAS